MGGPDPVTLPWGEGVSVLKSIPVGLLACYKPAGVLSHPNKGKDAGRALLRAPYDLQHECYRVQTAKGDGDGEVWLLNRLDSATSGVLLCATDPVLAEAVRELFAQGRVRKVYYALVFGVMSPPRQVWRDRLHVSKTGGQLRTTAEGGAFAETEVRLQRVYPGKIPVSLLELRPKTGRTHQLRVQSAQRDLPIIGDETYGSFAWNKEFARRTGHKRLFLHSTEIQLSLPSGGRSLSFQARAPLPPEFSPRR